MLIFFLSIAISIIIYKRTKNAKVAIFICLFMILSGFMTALITEILQKIINISEIFVQPLEFVFMTMLAYGIGRIISNIYKKYPVSNEKIKEYSTYFLFAFFSVIYTIIYLLLNALVKSDYRSMIFIAVLPMFIAVSLLIYKENLKAQYERLQLENDSESLEQYAASLEEMMKEFRSFKHDYSNILSTISGYLEGDDISGLKQYYKKELVPYSINIESANTRLALLSNILIKPLKGIVTSKVIEAGNRELSVFIDIEEIIESVNMNVVDLCRIIGILMDNAIEGAELSTEKTIEFGIIRKTEVVIIIINNSCSKDVPEIHELFRSGLTTKGNGRGIGLWNIKELIDNKYPQVFLSSEIDRELGSFKQRLAVRFDKENNNAENNNS